MKKWTNRLLIGSVCIVFFYVMVSLTVFRFRHAWMTETELTVHIPEALMWKTVPYDKARK